MQYTITDENGHSVAVVDIPDKFKGARVVNLVLEWDHYEGDDDVFGEPEDNRKQNKTLMKKLEVSIPAHGQLQPATVNRDGKIWEGNHRKKVTKKTNMPYVFIVDNGNHNLSQAEYTDEINEVREDYKIEDWLDRYVTRYERGEDKYEPYQRFKSFVSGGSIYNNLIYFSPDDSGRGQLKEGFIAGEFNPTDNQWALAQGYKNMIDEVGKKWGNDKATKLSYFMVAYIRLLQNDDFSHMKFLKQLNRYSSYMRECAKSDDYISQINVIYNKGSAVVNKKWLA